MCYLNDSEEFVRSLFHNKPNEDIIIVFVSKIDNYSRLLCRSIPFQLIFFREILYFLLFLTTILG